MLNAPCRSGAHRNHCERKTDAETNHQGNSKTDLLELKADEQNGERGGAWQKTTGQAEQYDLSGGRSPIGKAARDVSRMRSLVRILVTFIGAVQPFVVMVVFVERKFIITASRSV